MVRVHPPDAEGFSLAELLVGISILGLLAVLIGWLWARGRSVKRTLATLESRRSPDSHG